MQRMSRAQRILVMYILMKLQEPRLIQRFTRRYVGGGSLTKHGNAFHTTAYSDADAVAAVEAEATLDLTGVIPDSAYPNALLLDSSRNMVDEIKVQCATTGFKYASIYAVKADLTEIKFMRYSGLLNTLQLGHAGINLNVLGNWSSDITPLAAKSIDCKTYGAYFRPRRLSQSAQPTVALHELMIWRDPDDNTVHLLYNDEDEGVIDHQLN